MRPITDHVPARAVLSEEDEEMKSSDTEHSVPGVEHAPSLRIMSLHALAYCPRLFYLEEVEQIRVANAAVFAGRELHAALEADEDGVRTRLDLADPDIGLVGKVDAIRRRDGSLLPYEHKRGRCRRDGSAAAAWPSDRLQVIAYAVLIESTTGATIPEGRIRYHADNVTVRVPIDDQARADLAEAIATARGLRESTDRPPVAANERLCIRCSLAPVCLPEEVRQADDPDRDPLRLYPPDRDGTTLHIMTPGTGVGRGGDSLIVKPPDGQTASKHPIREIDSLLLHGYTQVTTQALNLCVDRGVPVHWLTTTGRHVASLTATTGQVQRRVRQYRALSDEAVCLRLAKALVRAKVEGQHRYLLRASRGDVDVREAMAPDLAPIRSALAFLDAAPDRERLRGLEGSAAVGYFRGLTRLLSPAVPESLRYTTRSRRPPLDRFNALLGFGYGLLHTAVMRAVLAAGLEPALGFFHTPRSAAHPLVLDLMELFRVPLWDLVLVGSLNRGQWDPDADFVATKAKVWLSDGGRRKAVGLFEARLDETWKHPVVGYSLSYARNLELEARLLEKEWSGETGLFARLRLR
jgi:CRISPR-associated protein Cas1